MEYSFLQAFSDQGENILQDSKCESHQRQVDRHLMDSISEAYRC